jgi:hypothetical protein
MKDLFVKRFEIYKKMGDALLDRLSQEQIFWQYNEESNSVAVLVKHITGNSLSRWTNFLTEDGEKSWRHRDAEFINDFTTKQEVIECWQKGLDCLYTALQLLQEDDLGKTIYIRGEKLSVVDAFLRQLAHYSYHIGQMIYLGKMQKNTEWKSLSIPRNQSQQYNDEMAKKNEDFSQENSSPVCFAKSPEIRDEYKI